MGVWKARLVLGWGFYLRGSEERAEEGVEFVGVEVEVVFGESVFGGFFEEDAIWNGVED